MSADQDRRRRDAFKHRPGSPYYDVGYGKPPEEHRFKPGTSGNPRGRPRGSKNRRPSETKEHQLQDILLKEARRRVTVTENNRPIRMTVVQAIVRSMAIRAAKGDTRSQRSFTGLVVRAELGSMKRRQEAFTQAYEYKMQWRAELARLKQEFIRYNDPIPHPEDIHLNFRDGTVNIKGPASIEEKEELDQLLAFKKIYEEGIELSERYLSDKPDAPDRADVLEEIDFCKKMLAKISKALPERYLKAGIS